MSEFKRSIFHGISNITINAKFKFASSNLRSCEWISTMKKDLSPRLLLPNMVKEVVVYEDILWQTETMS